MVLDPLRQPAWGRWQGLRCLVVGGLAHRPCTPLPGLAARASGGEAPSSLHSISHFSCVRAKRLDQLREDLAACRAAPPLALPPPAPLPGRPEELEGTASNAVPFPAGTDVKGLPGPLPRAERVHACLPWLFLALGRPDRAGLEALASAQGLPSLRLVDLSRFAEGSVSCLPPHVRWVGPERTPGLCLAAATALGRLAARATAAGSGAEDRRAALAMVHPRHAGFAAEVLCLTLRLRWGMPEAEAAEAASALCGAAPSPEQTAACAAELTAFFYGWTRRVNLVWPYGGSCVEVVGDLVGGWHCRVPLRYNHWRREWRLQLLGVMPGVHRFKFIVDGRWCADLNGAVEHDFWGNANNVVVVLGTGSAEPGASGAAQDGSQEAPLSRETQASQQCCDAPFTPEAKLGAALLSFYCKMQ